jgi:uncharacterized protein (DUF697 family)
MGLLAGGARFVRPLADAVRGAQAIAQENGVIALLPGDPEGTERLSELLGDSEPVPSEDALAVLVVRPDTDIATGAAALARRRHSGGGALAIIVGDAIVTAGVEARLLKGHHLEPSNIAHVPTLDGEGGTLALEAVVRALGDRAPAAARRYPGLRPMVGRQMVTAASRRAGVIGALPLPGVDLPVLALIQVRLVSELAAIHDRAAGTERAVDAAAVVAAGFGWRAVGRSASCLVPGVGWAVRGTVAYGATRAVGEAALARSAAGHDLIEGAPLDKVRPVVDRVVGRLSR